MELSGFFEILEISKKYEGVSVCCAGNNGRELISLLLDYSLTNLSFMDNNVEKNNLEFRGIKIQKPRKIKNTLYVIAVSNKVFCLEMKKTLLDLGVFEDDIKWTSTVRKYDEYVKLKEDAYKTIINSMFKDSHGYDINWKNPRTYSEIINWEKLYNYSEIKSELADKYKVRNWVNNKINEDVLVKLYGVWEKVEDIEFDKLPQSFVLKVNNGSGKNIIVKNKKDIDISKIKEQLNEMLDFRYEFVAFEMQYKYINPKIICEEYMVGLAENVLEYNIFCFHGEPKYIWCIRESHKPNCKASFYDINWEIQPFSYGYPKDDVIAPRPQGLERMLEYSRMLSKDFNHVRVDWFNMPDGRVLFGEMTFSTWGGIMHFCPEEMDLEFGSLIK